MGWFAGFLTGAVAGALFLFVAIDTQGPRQWIAAADTWLDENGVPEWDK